MKKLHLSIPTPCHEDWAAMTQADKGKFCHSCQKTVIDFTSMNDRQLAEFFKKPVTSVCGRFHHDQLHRDIPISKKRIPWARYLFQVTWPAFVLFLKSCGNKDVKGETAVRSTATTNDPYKLQAPLSAAPDYKTMMVGSLSFQTIDSLPTKISLPLADAKETISEEKSEAMPTTIIVGDVLENFPDTIVQESSPMEEVVVTAHPPTLMGKLVMGSVTKISQCDMQTTSDTGQKHAIPELAAIPMPTYKLFPNPVTAGSLLTISFGSTEQMPERVEILSSSGQMIFSSELPDREATVFNVRMPVTARSGMYFVRLSHHNWKSNVTEKIVVQ